MASQSEAISDELKKRRDAIEQAREVICSDASYRRKTELVRQVVSKAVAYFQPTGKLGNQPKSELIKLEIFPSDDRSSPKVFTPGQDSRNHLLVRLLEMRIDA